jgi:hypothetical protein
MHFQVIQNRSSVPSEGRNIGYLWTDNWNDWFKYCTLYVLTYFDSAGAKHDIGGVKIGEFGMEADQLRPNLPSRFQTLEGRFFPWGRMPLVIKLLPRSVRMCRGHYWSR